MSAPAASHDLRCPHVNSPDPSVPCNCSRGASVLRLPVGGSRLCAMCGGAPAWQVGPSVRACDRCLPGVLADYYDRDYDGFSPCVVLPLSRRGGSA